VRKLLENRWNKIRLALVILGWGPVGGSKVGVRPNEWCLLPAVPTGREYAILQ
jgi:hypothetical protein